MAKSAAQKAFEASQKRARTQHQIAQIQASGVNPNPLGGNPLGAAGTQGDYGKGGPGVAPVPQPQPFDPAFEAQKLGATWNIQTADAGAGFQRGETAWGLGYNADASLNTSNPYSQAMLLQDNYKRSVTGTNNSMAAAGQLYSGARLNAQGRNDRLYAEGSSALKDQARRTYHGIGQEQLQTYGANSLGVSQGGFDALRRAIYGS
jgi:hypothetical protein